VLPFKPFTRLVTKYLVGRDRDKRAARSAEKRENDGSSKAGKPASERRTSRSAAS
jgi:hypothetical protein